MEYLYKMYLKDTAVDVQQQYSHLETRRNGLHMYVDTPSFTVSMGWHRRKLAVVISMWQLEEGPASSPRPFSCMASG